MAGTGSLHLGASLAEARVICVFVHGRGQAPEAMRDAIVAHLATPGVAYVLPRAAQGQWYAARAIDALTGGTRAELAASLAQLRAAVAAVSVAGVPLVLGGFSQGACLSLELAFADGPWRGGLVALTGCRVGQAGCARPARALDGMPVYLSGGDADPWIPVQAFAETAGLLGAAQARLRAEVFPGRPHAADPAELATLDAMLADLAAGRAVFGGAAA